jgi:hypothetical protein
MGAELTTCLFLSATATAAGEDTKQTPLDMIRIRFSTRVVAMQRLTALGLPICAIALSH